MGKNLGGYEKTEIGKIILVYCCRSGYFFYGNMDDSAIIYII